MMIGRRECMVSVCVAALFTAGARTDPDPRAGQPEGERIALWPEGKIPSVEVRVTNQDGVLICHVTGMGYRKSVAINT